MTFNTLEYLSESRAIDMITRYADSMSIKCEPDLLTLIDCKGNTSNWNTSRVECSSLRTNLAVLCESVDLVLGKFNAARGVVPARLVGTNAGCWVRVINPGSTNEQTTRQLTGSLLMSNTFERLGELLRYMDRCGSAVRLQVALTTTYLDHLKMPIRTHVVQGCRALFRVVCCATEESSEAYRRLYDL